MLTCPDWVAPLQLPWNKIKKNGRVLLETIPEIYFRTNEDVYGVTLHMVTVGLLKDPEDDQRRNISFQSLKKKRKVSQIKTEPVENMEES